MGTSEEFGGDRITHTRTAERATDAWGFPERDDPLMEVDRVDDTIGPEALSRRSQEEVHQLLGGLGARNLDQIIPEKHRTHETHPSAFVRPI